MLRTNEQPNPALKSNVCFMFAGLFHLVKMPCLNELVPRMPETLDLAFRVRRKKFTIEVRTLEKTSLYTCVCVPH